MRRRQRYRDPVAVGRAGRTLQWLGGLVVLVATSSSCGLKTASQEALDSASTLPPATAAPRAAGSFPVPVAVSADHRYLLDQHGQPFMIFGDSPQCLSANLSVGDMDYFF